PLLALTLLAAGCAKLISTEGTPDSAKHRVSFILQMIKEHGSSTSKELQTAICRWDQDKVVLSDRDELGLASDAFDLWRQKGNIYPTLETYEIADKVEEKGASDPDKTFYVQAKIDGTWHWVRVPMNARITWADEAR
ncbi:MAG TPA: hypothetical protein VGR07_21025, partial [Thermoanaerobaculia bacterium]|nr:hypothetical protein [Thermoanaerobaculia bacterium]